MSARPGPARRRIAVVGAGWAGLAAAVRAVQHGADVTLFEMARQPGGRARQIGGTAGEFDNGQHILIGAYSATLDLMRAVGADPDTLLLRQPLVLAYPDGRGLTLSTGPPLPAFVRGVLGASGWRWTDRLTLLGAAARWLASGFRCPAELTVGHLCSRLPRQVRADLIEPLCVAALNTPMNRASAQVFLRVLQDALFSGPGSADLLLPRVPLSALLPDPAWRWLADAGAQLRPGHRVQRLEPHSRGWRLDDEPFDAVVLASTAREAARLARAVQPGWAATAASLCYEPIITAYLADARLRLPRPMLALTTGNDAPAQFVFDLGAISGTSARHGCFAFVISGAGPWVSAGRAAGVQALLRQARCAWPGSFSGPDDAVLLHLVSERRATFACTPGLCRPGLQIAPGLVAAGDHVAGPYPATLEGAVRSGLAAADALA